MLVQKSFRIFAPSLYSYEPWAFMVRLTSLSKYVDKFVLGYSETSFQGNPLPPLSFEPFTAEIESFGNQLIIYFISLLNLTKCQEFFPNDSKEWARDKYAHTRMIDPLVLPEYNIHMSPADVIYYADCDEIPSQETMHKIVRGFRLKLPTYVSFVPAIFGLRWIREYRFNASFFIHYGNLKGKHLIDLRQYFTPGTLTGVHISWGFPKLQTILQKFRTFAHPEFNLYPRNLPEYLFVRQICGGDMFDPKMTITDVGTDLSHYIPTMFDTRFRFLTETFSDNEALLTMNASLVRQFATCPEVITEFEQRLLKLKSNRI